MENNYIDWSIKYYCYFQILNRVQSKKRVPKKKEKPVPKETTVFTEEDFKKFEKEYFE